MPHLPAKHRLVIEKVMPKKTKSILHSESESNAGHANTRQHGFDLGPIDAVITWVDGSDPRWRKNRDNFFQVDNDDDTISDARYTTAGEIYYCVAGIIKNTTFFRNIFIVTDKQDPKIVEFFLKRFGIDLSNKIKIIDHSEIFSGYEHLLPTFNSTSIETMLHRIPGLAERYVYFNDDFIIAKPIKTEDFFIANKPVLRGQQMSAKAVSYFRWSLAKLEKGEWAPKQKRFSFKDYQLRAFELFGPVENFFWVDHTPYPIFRPTLEHYFEEHKDVLLKNAQYKTRHHEQFSPMALANALEIRAGRAIFDKPRLTYCKPSSRKAELLYIWRKRLSFMKRRPKFLCMQALSEAKPGTRKIAIAWLDRLCFRDFNTALK